MPTAPGESCGNPERVAGDKCPPPDSGKKRRKDAKTVQIRTLVAALKEIESWTSSVRDALSTLPPGMEIKLKGKKTKKTKKAKKKAKKK